MTITIDMSGERPIYRQVADEIRTLIARGDLSEGQALPPVRQLAADLDVNLNTIATAYRSLQDEGLISIKHGTGATVASRRTQSANPTALRRMLADALAQMVLAGMPRDAIMEIVTSELRSLRKGMK